MPEAYDQEGVVDQEKRFAVALQRYRSVGTKVCFKPSMRGYKEVSRMANTTTLS